MCLLHLSSKTASDKGWDWSWTHGHAAHVLIQILETPLLDMRVTQTCMRNFSTNSPPTVGTVVIVCPVTQHAGSGVVTQVPTMAAGVTQ